MKRLLILFLFFVQFATAQADLRPYVQPAVFSLSVIMMHDVVNPPAASRYYAYCLMGAYAIINHKNSAIIPLEKIVNRFSNIQISETNFNKELAATYCILETGRLMLPSGENLQEDQLKLLDKIRKKKNIKSSEITASIAVAKTVALQVVAFAKQDNYGKLSARLRYTPKRQEGYWYPTPPSYMEAVEPNWKTIIPLILDSAEQCKTLPPVAYSTDSSSDFFKLATEVYTVTKKLTEEQLHIASFWDCNPFVVATAGHMSLGFKKISPGGHWMNIACIAAKKADLPFNETIQLLAIAGITQMDAFICCWEEKYKSNRIRPETFINKHIDIKWQPLLQTPPFPEYTSGHSVVSNASAEVLSYFLGDTFAYSDNTELMFEIPERSFTSFRQAAAEAAISRLYGGIHFRDAIENGAKQGKAIGDLVTKKLREAGMKSFR
ncbi:MAG: vanadium-dependent haloperoxidase [Bacteroidota bacterium]